MEWNSVMKSHVDSGHYNDALLFYRKMREEGVRHDSFTFPIINRAVLLVNSRLAFGEILHCVAMKTGFGLDLYFGNTMIEVYGKSGCLGYATKLFDEILERDLVSWTSLISGHVRHGNICGAFTLFKKMRMDMEPNSVTLIVLLQGCSASGSLIEGRQMHCYAINSGLLVDRSVENSFLRFYTRIGSIEAVVALSSEIYQKDIVSWNTMISFYSLRGDIEKVIESFSQMQGEVEFGAETLTLVISALAKSGILTHGEKLHSCAVKLGLCNDVLQTSLLDFYAKCGKLRSSTMLFEEIPCRSSITWSAMMSGYIQNGYLREAIDLFKEMQAAGVEARAETLSSILNASIHMGALHLGKEIHGYFIRNSFDGYGDELTHLETSILNMYIRCGCISSARVCFDRMLVKDIVTWTSMIEGYGTHGLGFDALKLFCQMVEEGITPNSVTFLSLLSACSHAGVLEEGCKVFHSMKWRFGVEPDLDHYTCMVDLLGRSGKLKEALAIILKMMVLPDGRIWGALLAGCRIHGHRELGEYAAQKLLEIEPDNVGYRTLLSNVEASSGLWNEVEEVRRAVFEKDLKKKPGWSLIVEKGQIHCFVSGDRSHNWVGEIYEVLGCLSRKVKEFDYVKSY